MGLREQAAADLKRILEDTDGFGWAISVTDPSGSVAALTGFSSDIGTTIDPETGQAISGRRASVALAIVSLTTAGLGLPTGTADKSSKPWRVTFDDVGGSSHTYAVIEAMPDRAIGVVTCLLEAWKP